MTVTEPVEENAALETGTAASATFFEPGYPPSGLVNGNLTDKGWSTWKPTAFNSSDTVTITLPRERDVTRVVSRFFRDGRDSYAESLQVQTRGPDGTWRDAGDPVSVPDGSPAPVVDVPITPVRTDAVRVVFTNRPDMYITMSEIEVMAKAADPG